ncbi:type II toxin-antitoxin system PemK/MazF family toxin [Aureimonas glaciei]|uniref:mRNA-degrading endonuclease n=1 Tax=Aureimonas glaciei TaxID=1776957 RepID=A0A916XUA0_9HYPH|nr:type II toxin-antitoxin system PemK/MazF family toxin [Aureimonas glaciei]GGD12641.1 mRNA-degrading endonuclease [Aureimonas glaciei]
MAPYTPRRFDIIQLSFDPQAGREQAGRRPAYVLSDDRYNALTRLCVVCPITTRVKGFPFEVALPQGFRTRGVVLCDHVKSISWDQRGSEFIENCPDIAPRVLGMLKALIGL